jgi:hypothetical protein
MSECRFNIPYSSIYILYIYLFFLYVNNKKKIDMMTFLKPKPRYHWSQGYDVFKKNRHAMSDNLAYYTIFKSFSIFLKPLYIKLLYDLVV